MISSCKTVSHISNDKIDFERYADKKNISSFKVLENIKDPIISFIFSPKGLMVNASVEGTKITKIDPPN